MFLDSRREGSRAGCLRGPGRGSGPRAGGFGAPEGAAQDPARGAHRGSRGSGGESAPAPPTAPTPRAAWPRVGGGPERGRERRAAAGPFPQRGPCSSFLKPGRSRAPFPLAARCGHRARAGAEGRGLACLAGDPGGRPRRTRDRGRERAPPGARERGGGEGGRGRKAGGGVREARSRAAGGLAGKGGGGREPPAPRRRSLAPTCCLGRAARRPPPEEPPPLRASLPGAGPLPPSVRAAAHGRRRGARGQVGPGASWARAGARRARGGRGRGRDPLQERGDARSASQGRPQSYLGCLWRVRVPGVGTPTALPAERVPPGGASAGALDSDGGRGVSETFPHLSSHC